MNNSFASLMLAQFEAATSADDYMLPLELGAAAAGSPKVIPLSLISRASEALQHSTVRKRSGQESLLDSGRLWKGDGAGW